MFKLKDFKESFFLFIANSLPRFNFFNSQRFKIIKLAGININGKCKIWSGFDIRPIGYASNLTIERNTFINRNFRAAMPLNGKILIKENVSIGPNVMLETAYHGFKLEDRKKTYSKSIVIGKNVWIGAGSIILAGVEIGDNSIVAAGSVVRKSVPSNVLVAGVPAIVKKNLN